MAAPEGWAMRVWTVKDDTSDERGLGQSTFQSSGSNGSSRPTDAAVPGRRSLRLSRYVELTSGLRSLITQPPQFALRVTTGQRLERSVYPVSTSIHELQCTFQVG